VNVAETFSMRAGYSEHQTGLAFDLKHNSGKLYRNNDKTYDHKTDFIYQHAHEFGFIVRYRADWQEITGIKSEPWHLRYLGVELAAAVFSADVPLETFLDVEGGDYSWNEQ
jgi:LAS superfamily LD-carboxypeptidase LdcB